MKEEALKLADELDALHQYVPSEAPAMIRRLVEELYKPELNGGGFPVKNATYWKRQYNLMSAQNDRLKSGIYHANEQIKYLESLAPQTKPTITKLDGKVVAITMTDDEHRVHEVLWEAPKPLSDEEIDKLADEYLSDYFNMQETINFAKAIEERHGIK